jgi:hypothetical protein
VRTRKDDGHSSTGLVPTTRLAREGVDPDGGTDRRPLHRGGSAFAPGRSGILGCRFGGHFHNDNAVGVLRDVPGVVIASPARPDDAAAMLRTCVAAAKADGSVC